MRQDQQQVSSDRPEAVRSAPVPVPPPEDGPTGDAAARRGRDTGGRAEVPEDVLDDRGTFDDPTMADEHSGPDARRREADSDGVPEFHEPAPLPTAFGATTVGGAVAASAMASGRPEDERDPRGEDTVRPGDGAPGRTDAFDDERADPTAADRLHDRARWAAGDEHTEVRHADGTGSDRADGRGGADRTQQDAVLAGAAGVRADPEPSMIDPRRHHPGRPPRRTRRPECRRGHGGGPAHHRRGARGRRHPLRAGHRPGLPGPLARRPAALRR
ncbi:hypothetical protein MCAG_01701 [Micromonospora sp. ATCC 39149]|uniref:hypothetical protein n=1 Tax=Micromonospora sp. (strain ATCC 39149 / NRRL 15099 / SCC 1413) TaxID=219305 RepID=UPI0001A51291|nr:hypothetical protein [Micromonospora sp. ATCC 39149]EEP71374.1 hypothetical protein MCAG_01701 [Micromonospora sp. ATCC 39149]